MGHHSAQRHWAWSFRQKVTIICNRGIDNFLFVLKSFVFTFNSFRSDLKDLAATIHSNHHQPDLSWNATTRAELAAFLRINIATISADRVGFPALVASGH